MWVFLCAGDTKHSRWLAHRSHGSAAFRNRPSCRETEPVSLLCEPAIGLSVFSFCVVFISFWLVPSFIVSCSFMLSRSLFRCSFSLLVYAFRCLCPLFTSFILSHFFPSFSFFGLSVDFHSLCSFFIPTSVFISLRFLPFSLFSLSFITHFRAKHSALAFTHTGSTINTAHVKYQWPLCGRNM